VSVLQKPDGTLDGWRVEEIDGDGEGSCFVAEFSGHRAEERNCRFAERLNTHAERRLARLPG
jgi:hypothetical protein